MDLYAVNAFDFNRPGTAEHVLSLAGLIQSAQTPEGYEIKWGNKLTAAAFRDGKMPPIDDVARGLKQLVLFEALDRSSFLSTNDPRMVINNELRAAGMTEGVFSQLKKWIGNAAEDAAKELQQARTTHK